MVEREISTVSGKAVMLVVVAYSPQSDSQTATSSGDPTPLETLFLGVT